METGHDFSRLFIELGGVAIGLALLARLGSRWGFSSISLFLLGGLACGRGGLVPLNLSRSFIQVGAEIGVLLLLFMLGLEYSGEQLRRNLRSGMGGAAIDFLLNFPPGVIAGLLLGWKWLPSILLGGITFISSSGIVARILQELRRTDAPETPTVLSILVLEDLVMAVYLPLVAVLLAGGGAGRIAISVGIAVVTVLVALFLATRYGASMSEFAEHQSEEVILLTVFGAVLLVAGLAQRLQVSAAIGAFLVGIAASGPLAEQAHRLMGPLRDLFAATFFFFFGLEIDPRALPSVLLVALALAGVTTLTKILTGYGAARKTGIERRARLRAGLTLVARGEFSIVIAGLAASAEPQLASLAAAYVLLMAVLGPILARVVR
ncbi:MAG TPA: cation:proton antiporter [Acidobacteriaceae bacterium]